jgi:hypothetical protein
MVIISGLQTSVTNIQQELAILDVELLFGLKK